jgi:hypothetical protein
VNDALDVARRYGAQTIVGRVQKGLVNINTVDRSEGAMLAAGLVAGTLPQNRAQFHRALAECSPESRARLRKIETNITRSLGRN